MKQCPNPKCIIYTRLDELPDTYLRCPQCDEPLVDVPVLSGTLHSSMLAEENTSPYTPVSVAAAAAPASRYSRPAPAPVTYEEPEYEYEEDPFDDPDAEPLRTVPPRSALGLRTVLTVFGLFALVAACLALTLTLGGRFLPPSNPVSSALATQTVLASYRPAINTPIPIFPTIPSSGAAGQDTNPGAISPPPPAQATPLPGGALPPTAVPAAPAAEVAPAQPVTTGPVPVLDALLCARLEGGQPVGPTSVYKPTDPFNLAVQADYGPGGAQTVLTRWYGPGGTLIYELRQNYTQKGTYYAGFTLSKPTPWAPGDYRVDIYTNNSPQPTQSVSFQVQP